MLDRLRELISHHWGYDSFRPLQQAQLESVTEGREQWLANMAVVSFYPLALAAAVGLVILHRRRRPVLPLAATIAAAVIGCAITLAVLRYRAGPAGLG